MSSGQWSIFEGRPFGLLGFIMHICSVTKKTNYFTKVIILFGLFCNSSFLFSQELSQDIFIFHKNIMHELSRLEIAQKHINHEDVLQILQTAHSMDDDYAGRVKKDIKQVRLTIKKLRKNKQSYDFEKKLLKNLEHIQKFMYKYRLPLDVINYHAMIKTTWQDLFDAVDAGKDIAPLLCNHDICHGGVKALKVLASRFDRIKDKIEDYEYRLHADWVSLKLANYVLRIETIRVRNAAIFHPQYKGKQIESNYPR